MGLVHAFFAKTRNSVNIKPFFGFFTPGNVLNLALYVYYSEDLETLLYKNRLRTCIHCDLFENCFISVKNCQKSVHFAYFASYLPPEKSFDFFFLKQKKN